MTATPSRSPSPLSPSPAPTLSASVTPTPESRSLSGREEGGSAFGSLRGRGGEEERKGGEGGGGWSGEKGEVVDRDAFDPVEAGEMASMAKYVSKGDVRMEQYRSAYVRKESMNIEKLLGEEEEAPTVELVQKLRESRISRDGGEGLEDVAGYKELYEVAVERIEELEEETRQQANLLDALRDAHANGIETATLAAGKAGAEAMRRGLRASREEGEGRKEGKRLGRKSSMRRKERKKRGEGKGKKRDDEHQELTAALEFKLMEVKDELHRAERRGETALAHMRVRYEERIGELERALKPLADLRAAHGRAEKRAETLEVEVRSLRANTRVQVVRDATAEAERLGEMTIRLRAQCRALSNRLDVVVASAKSAYERMGQWKRKYLNLVKNVRKIGDDSAVVRAALPAVSSLLDQIRNAHMGEEETARDLEYVRFVEAVEEETNLERYVEEEKHRLKREQAAGGETAKEKPVEGARLHPRDLFADATTQRRHAVENLAFERLGAIVPHPKAVGGKRTDEVFDLAGFQKRDLTKIALDDSDRIARTDILHDTSQPVARRVASAVADAPPTISPLPTLSGARRGRGDSDAGSEKVPPEEAHRSHMVAGMRGLTGGRMYKVGVDGEMSKDDKGVALPSRDGLKYIEGTLLDGKFAVMLASKSNHITRLERELDKLRKELAKSRREREEARKELRDKGEEMRGLLDRLRKKEARSMEFGGFGIGESSGTASSTFARDLLDSAVTRRTSAPRPILTSKSPPPSPTSPTPPPRPKSAATFGRSRRRSEEKGDDERASDRRRRVMAAMGREAVRRTAARATATRSMIGSLRWEVSKREPWDKKLSKPPPKHAINGNELDNEVDIFATVRHKTAAQLASLAPPHLRPLTADIRTTHPRLTTTKRIKY